EIARDDEAREGPTEPQVEEANHEDADPNRRDDGFGESPFRKDRQRQKVHRAYQRRREDPISFRRASRIPCGKARARAVMSREADRSGERSESRLVRLPRILDIGVGAEIVVVPIALVARWLGARARHVLDRVGLASWSTRRRDAVVALVRTLERAEGGVRLVVLARVPILVRIVAVERVTVLGCAVGCRAFRFRWRRRISSEGAGARRQVEALGRRAAFRRRRVLLVRRGREEWKRRAGRWRGIVRL